MQYDQSHIARATCQPSPKRISLACMSSLSHEIRKFNRFELKYLISLPQAKALQQALHPFLQPDDHGNAQGGYFIRSLYYDSADYRCYWEKIDGIPFRRKLRIRYYEDESELSDERRVFVEIKQRVDKTTQKRRVTMPYADARLLCDRRQIPEHASSDAGTLNEIYGLLAQYDMRPACIVRYRRQALMGGDLDLGLRVTFDTELQYRAHPDEMTQTQDLLPMLPADQVVMEIKANERVPYWLTELIAAHNLRAIRLSKYCRAIELSL